MNTPQLSTSLSAIARDLPAGTRYVLCVLRPLRGLTLDTAEIAATLRTLGGATPMTLPPGDYAAVAGQIGEPPRLVTASQSPFRERVSVGGVWVVIRMESWLATDTIRRMGFGHVCVVEENSLVGVVSERLGEAWSSVIAPVAVSRSTRTAS